MPLAVLIWFAAFVSAGLNGWGTFILRAGPSRLIYQTVEEQLRLALLGNILMDAPPHSGLMDLTDFASKGQTSLEVHVEANLRIVFIYYFLHLVIIYLETEI